SKLRSPDRGARDYRGTRRSRPGPRVRGRAALPGAYPVRSSGPSAPPRTRPDLLLAAANLVLIVMRTARGRSLAVANAVLRRSGRARLSRIQPIRTRPT